MPTNFKDIRADIKEAVETLTGANGKVQAVYAYDRSTFSGFPAVIISPSENSADYANTESDKLVFVFKVRAFYPITKESEHESAEIALEGVVDDLLNLFSDRRVIPACDWVEPTPSAWYYEERGEAVYRVAEISLRCRKYVKKSVC
jgi:hypothetical protein